MSSTTLPVCPKTGSTSPSLTVHLCLHTALLREIGNAPGDCVNALKAGTVDPAELENGTWRYPVRAGRITVVIAFRDVRTLTVITVWT